MTEMKCGLYGDTITYADGTVVTNDSEQTITPWDAGAYSGIVKALFEKAKAGDKAADVKLVAMYAHEMKRLSSSPLPASVWNPESGWKSFYAWLDRESKIRPYSHHAEMMRAHYASRKQPMTEAQFLALKRKYENLDAVHSAEYLWKEMRK